VEYLSAIFQPKTPILWQEVPSAHKDAPDNLQDTLDNLQETRDGLQEMHDDTQENSQVGNKMTFSWRDLSYDEDANTLLLDHFCRRGTSDKDPVQAR
jgi:hypothetical protein